MIGTYKPHEITTKANNDICNSIESLFDSITSIDSSFLHYIKNGYGPKQDRIVEHVERVFAYELYKRWSENPYVKANGLKVNAEISKQFYFDPENKKVKITYPDMVLHGGQETSDNLIICEIKRYENIKVHRKAQTKDLNSLGYFLNPELKIKNNIVEWKAYKYGVYLLIGEKCDLPNQDCSIQTLKNHIYLPKFDVPKDRRENIICLAYNGDCKNLFYATLDELL